jgi:hypothetical protein
VEATAPWCTQKLCDEEALVLGRGKVLQDVKLDGLGRRRRRGAKTKVIGEGTEPSGEDERVGERPA